MKILILTHYFLPHLGGIERIAYEEGRRLVRLGHEVTHEHIGQLLMLNSDADKQLVQVAGSHNSTGAQPTPLVSLIHVADNLAKDFGLGYLEDEKGIYNSSVLVSLGVTRKDIDGIRTSMGDSMVREVREIVSRCLRS